MAPTLAFFGFFSLTPLFALTVAVVGRIVDPLSVEAFMDSEIGRILPDDAATWVVDLFDEAVRNSGTVLPIALVLAVITGSGVFLAVQRVLNDIFHVPRHVVSGLFPELRRRLVAAVGALTIGLFAGLPLAIDAVLVFANRGLERLIGRSLVIVLSVASPLVALTLLTLILALMFRTMPDVKLPWMAIRRGALFTGLVFYLVARLIGWGLGLLPRYGTLGAVGAVAVVLIVAYVLGEVFVFGAEFTKVYADYLAHGDIASPSQRDPGMTTGELRVFPRRDRIVSPTERQVRR